MVRTFAFDTISLTSSIFLVSLPRKPGRPWLLRKANLSVGNLKLQEKFCLAN